MRGKEIFCKLVLCVDVTPDQTTHQNKKTGKLNWQMLAVCSSDDCIVELVACPDALSKICFGQFLWSVQGETHKGKSSKLLPLPRKNWRVLHRLLSWLPYRYHLLSDLSGWR